MRLSHPGCGPAAWRPPSGLTPARQRQTFTHLLPGASSSLLYSSLKPSLNTTFLFLTSTVTTCKPPWAAGDLSAGLGLWLTLEFHRPPEPDLRALGSSFRVVPTLQSCLYILSSSTRLPCLSWIRLSPYPSARKKARCWAPGLHRPSTHSASRVPMACRFLRLSH